MVGAQGQANQPRKRRGSFFVMSQPFLGGLSESRRSGEMDGPVGTRYCSLGLHFFDAQVIFRVSGQVELRRRL
jgi:hypothetical protein